MEKNFEKTKSIYTLFADIFSGKHQQFSTYLSQIGKKNQDYQEGFWRQRGQT